MKKPPTIFVREVLDRERDPKWNYARMRNLRTGNITLVPCCRKKKPCWECVVD